ncbi:hypothetical protein BB559_004139 [Furculomyces boomerangus]|uniref:Uncharacterized protein n=1 Tax=Furculomyces boomerangus TaxID=61424 RepID=A0A2T9YGJ0_9FUNG|nr:hypothetical protein BB559_004139 [Furculomyces boomerangus]
MVKNKTKKIPKNNVDTTWAVSLLIKVISDQKEDKLKRDGTRSNNMNIQNLIQSLPNKYLLQTNELDFMSDVRDDISLWSILAFILSGIKTNFICLLY